MSQTGSKQKNPEAGWSLIQGWFLQGGAKYYLDPGWSSIYEVERLWVAARLATTQQQYPRAATLFGVADQAHSQIHYAIAGPIRTLADTALATVQAALESALFTEAFATGQQMALEEVFATLLAPTPIAAKEGKTVTHEWVALPS